MKTIHDIVFKERLIYWRNKRRLTQTELAEASGLQQSAIFHFETGKRSPSLNSLMKICEALKIYPNDISCIEYEWVPTTIELLKQCNSRKSKDDENHIVIVGKMVKQPTHTSGERSEG